MLFAKKQNPLISVPPKSIPTIASHHAQPELIGKLPWPHPYEDTEKRFKWHVISIQQMPKSDGKLLINSEETFTAENLHSVSAPQQKGSTSAELYTFHPYAFEIPHKAIDAHHGSPFSYSSGDAAEPDANRFTASENGQVLGAPQQHESLEHYARAKEHEEGYPLYHHENAHYYAQHAPFVHIDKK